MVVIVIAIAIERDLCSPLHRVVAGRKESSLLVMEQGAQRELS